MTIESTLTLKQLQTFLLAKWKLGQDDHYVETRGEQWRKECDEKEVGEEGYNSRMYKDCTCHQQIHFYHTYDITNMPPFEPSQSSQNRIIHTAMTPDIENGKKDIDHTGVSLTNSAQEITSSKSSMQSSSQPVIQQHKFSLKQKECSFAPSSSSKQHNTQLAECATQQQKEPASFKCLQMHCCCSEGVCNRECSTSIRRQELMYDGRSATLLNCSLHSTFITIQHMVNIHLMCAFINYPLMHIQVLYILAQLV